MATRTSTYAGRWFGIAVIVASGAMMVLPFLWTLSTSLTPSEEVLQLPPQLIPANPTLDA